MAFQLTMGEAKVLTAYLQQKLFSSVFLLSSLAASAIAAEAPPTFENDVEPFLKKSCQACHNAKLKTADLSLSVTNGKTPVTEDPEKWRKVAARLRAGTMPPKGFPRPLPADVDAVTKWIDTELVSAELAVKPDPGRVTAHRLNRSEYNNTIRDLLGVNSRPADAFPQDDSGYGFDNIGDVLSLSPVLMEKYLGSAEKVVRMALFGPDKLKPTLVRHQPTYRDYPLSQKTLTDYDLTGLSMPNALHTMHRFPVDGEYVIRIVPEGRRPNGSEPVQMALWLDGKQIQVLDVDAPSDGFSIDVFGQAREYRVRVSAGDHWLAGSVLHLYEGLPASYGGPNPSTRPAPPPPDVSKFMKVPPNASPEEIAQIRKRTEARIAANKVPANRVYIHYIEVVGPYNQTAGPSLESRQKVYACGHLNGHHQPSCDRKIVAEFARRAFRRPVTAKELEPYLNLVATAKRHGGSFDDALAGGLEAVLVSPDFLFRIEPGNPAAKTPEPVSEFALASRLSYFLWSSMPDDELLRCAERQTLRKRDVLETQVRRMLKDPKSQALVENFAGQWLELRRLESVVPDREKFPEFDDYLRMSMRQETETFFGNVIHEDRSILDFIDAKYTFVNQKLAEFYGIPGVKGTEFQKVDLTGTPRGGALSQASVLTVSSYATRTSPVLRGKWILENFLNDPPPPPPPNVPALDESKIGSSGSIRQQMEAHRENPACASCHSKMDPLGFGFENFNAIGSWRTQDGKFPVDATGTLPDGRSFNGPNELKTLLRAKPDAFAECVADKLLTYALGRGLERYDRRTVREIAKQAAAQDYRFSSLVLEIVNSLPFQMRRGDRGSS